MLRDNKQVETYKKITISCGEIISDAVGLGNMVTFALPQIAVK